MAAFATLPTTSRQRRPDRRSGFQAVAGRSHHYVALICPWASRTLIGRKLTRLEEVISFSIVGPALTDQGWRLGDEAGADCDAVHGATYLHEIYTQADCPEGTDD